MDYHQSVLLNTAVDFLDVKEGSWYIDATLGGGGHTKEVLKRGGKVLAIDQDAEAIAYSTSIMNPYISTGDLILVHGNFSHLSEITKGINHPFSGIIFDLGVSSHQFDAPGRGFSFSRDELLDMRMNQEFGASAKDLVNGLNVGELTELFQKLGEEKFAKRIAEKIVDVRKNGKIESTRQLADLVSSVVPKSVQKIHPATRIFQALRIAVNDELNSLKFVLPQVLEILENGGRIVFISFHSLEDRIVKDFFKEMEDKGLIRILTGKPLIPTIDEINSNPRARSAKLRAAEKIS